MAGLTNQSYRTLAVGFGASLVFSEMASGVALSHRGKLTLKLISKGPGEDKVPFGIQIFGKDPKVMAEAAKIAVYEKGADLIDLNFACPARKVIKSGHGAALLKDMDLCLKIAEELLKSSPVPVSIKTRPGFTPPQKPGEEPFIFSLAPKLEDMGISAITLHPRYASQGFHGEADWNLVKELSLRLKKTSLIGSGDISSPEIALERLKNSGASALMLGRATRGRPWLFRECLEALKSDLSGTPSRQTPLTLSLRRETALRHARLLYEEAGEKAVFRLRTILIWYLKELPGAAAFRKRICSETDFERQLDIVREGLS
jgi:tRNA-dihydrouridine synthase B